MFLLLNDLLFMRIILVTLAMMIFLINSQLSINYIEKHSFFVMIFNSSAIAIINLNIFIKIFITQF